MSDHPGMAVYRPDPDAPAARVLADLERLAVTRAELPGRLVRDMLVDPACALTDLSALETITCTDDTPVPADAGDLLGSSIERRQAPCAAPPQAELIPAVVRARLRTGAERAGDAEMSGIALGPALQMADDLDRAALLTMLHALRIPASGVDVGEVMAPVVPEYRPLVRRWLAALGDHGLLEGAGGRGGAQRVRATRAVAATDIAESWDRVERGWRQSLSPDSALDGAPRPGTGSKTLAYARASADRLPELLRGAVSPMSLLFPDGSPEVARALYREPPVGRYQLAAVAGFVSELADALPGDRPLRLLEVGGGTGATTERVLAALDGHPVDYLFTDLSDYFLTAAQDLFGTGRFPAAAIRVGRFDIDGTDGTDGTDGPDGPDGPDGADDQGVGGGFDVVLAGGVLNNARDTDRSLRLLTARLAPGGWLLITEPTREVQWIAMSQAFLMTAATDERQRSGETFLSHRQWLAAFDRIRELDLVLDLPPTDHPLRRAGHRFFALQRSSAPTASGATR